MGTLRHDTTLESHSAEAYEETLRRIAVALHRCGDDVLKRGSGTGQVKGAEYVVHAITACLANLPLNRLIELAHAADVPANTPAVLLDRAAGGVIAVLEKITELPELRPAEEDMAVQLAEGALRGAGFIR